MNDTDFEVEFENCQNIIIKPEIDTVDASTGSGEDWNYSVHTITKKYFAVRYLMENYHHKGLPGNNGCCGIILNGNESNACVYLLYNGAEPSNQIYFGPWWSSDSEYYKNANSNDISIPTGGKADVILVGEVDNGNATYTCYINGKQLDVWGKDRTFTGTFNGQIGWATKLSNSTATLYIRESDTPIGIDGIFNV